MMAGRLFAVALALVAFALPAAAADPWKALAIGRPMGRVEAPPFTLLDLAGRPVMLEALRGRAVLLYFWATW